MQLRDERLVAVVEALDDVRLPQRLAAVERTARDVGRERGELTRAARRGKRGAAQVVVEVEVGVVDPRGHVEAERHLDEAAAQRRHEMEAILEERPHPLVELGGAARNRRRVDHGDADDLHVCRRGLEGEEGGIEPGQVLHRRSSRRRDDECYVTPLRRENDPS